MWICNVQLKPTFLTFRHCVRIKVMPEILCFVAVQCRHHIIHFNFFN